MRPGRFDRKVRILRPDEQGRYEVLQVSQGGRETCAMLYLSGWVSGLCVLERRLGGGTGTGVAGEKEYKGLDKGQL